MLSIARLSANIIPTSASRLNMENLATKEKWPHRRTPIAFATDKSLESTEECPPEEDEELSEEYITNLKGRGIRNT